MTVRIPNDLRSLLRNHTANFPNASQHHKKLADYAIAALGSRAKKLGSYRFRLDSEIFENVVSEISHAINFDYQSEAGLYELIGGEVAGIPLFRTPDDLVAMAVCSARLKRNDARLNCERESVWDPSQPMIKAWGGVPFLDGKPLGRSIPPRGEEILELAPGGKLTAPQTRFQRPRLKIGWELSVNPNELPTVQLSIGGAPLTRLYFPNGRFHSTVAEQRAALDVLDPVFRFLLKELGALKRSAHRPRSSNDVDAALLHFHMGMSWKDVAKKLCGTNHKHNADCEAKCRQAAKRYYTQAKDPRKTSA